MDTNKNNGLRLVTSERTRDMDEVAREARARERVAVRGGRLSDAALYAEVASRAETVAARERELEYSRRTVSEDEATRERLRLERASRTHRLWGAALFGLAGFALLLLLTGCATTPPAGPLQRASLEAYTGAAVPSSQGKHDVADLGSYGIVGVSGAVGQGDVLTGAAGEWWIDYGSAAGEVDAGDLGLFDLEADVLRAGLGLRLGTIHRLGLDWGLGLGTCLTVVRGTASAGPDLSRDLTETGLGAYAAGTVSRGPFFLRTTYISGPSIDVEGYDVELGGLSVVGGLRWSL